MKHRNSWVFPGGDAVCQKKNWIRRLFYSNKNKQRYSNIINFPQNILPFLVFLFSPVFEESLPRFESPNT